METTLETLKPAREIITALMEDEVVPLAVAEWCEKNAGKQLRKNMAFPLPAPHVWRIVHEYGMIKLEYGGDGSRFVPFDERRKYLLSYNAKIVPMRADFEQQNVCYCAAAVERNIKRRELLANEAKLEALDALRHETLDARNRYTAGVDTIRDNYVDGYALKDGVEIPRR